MSATVRSTPSILSVVPEGTTLARLATSCAICARTLAVPFAFELIRLLLSGQGEDFGPGSTVDSGSHAPGRRRPTRRLRALLSSGSRGRLGPLSARGSPFYSSRVRCPARTSCDFKNSRPSCFLILVVGTQAKMDPPLFHFSRGQRSTPLIVSFADSLVQDFSDSWESPKRHGLGEQDKLGGEPDTLSGEPDTLSGEPDRLSGEPDALSGEPDTLSGEPDALSGEPDALSGEPDTLSGADGARPAAAECAQVEGGRGRAPPLRICEGPPLPEKFTRPKLASMVETHHHVR